MYSLHIHLHAIDLEDADVTEGADFVAVEKFYASCAFVEVVFEGDATTPVLDCARLGPKGEVEGLGDARIFLRVEI